MYIKKSRLVLGICAIVIITAIITVGSLNPFGIANLGNFLKLSYASKLLNILYYEDVDLENASQMAIAGVAASTGDPYTGYIWGDDAIEYLEDVEGNYCGVGLYIEWDIEENLISVVSAIAGGPAEVAGIGTGDKILKLDGTPYSGEEMSEAATYMRGEEGTEVVLTIRSAIDGKERDVTLVRSAIEIESVSGKMLGDSIGYISMTQFTENASAKLAAECARLKESGMNALILDLRNNPGGLLDEAVAAASLFVPEGDVITYTLDKFETREEYLSEGVPEDAKVNIPIAVLINQGSASASEVLTGALRDYELATVIGQKSYGKGVVQSVLGVGDGLMTITVARYYSPNGICIHGEGIEPDILVEMDPEKSARLTSLEPTEDEQLLAAVEYLNKR
ncbi:MAG: S41 family peptidase [Clostridia bacterium]|nr:S41 family peptidase [Clostridia bacterium]